MRRNRLSWPTTIIAVPIGIVIGLPLYYVFVNTFKTQAEMVASPLALPQEIYLRNYVEVFGNLPIAQSFWNTFVVTVASIALMLLIGAMAAFGMQMRASRFNRWFGLGLMVAFIIPGQSTLIPVYRFLVRLGLVDTLTGLVLLYSAGAVFCYYLVQGYLRSIPTEVIEAARIDGANHLQIFWRIVLPLIRPILVTVGVFQTMWVWNDFITPNIFISSPEKRTIVLQVYNAVGQYSTDWPSFMTLSVIVLAPMVVFFLLTQRHIVSGLLSGSVKG